MSVIKTRLTDLLGTELPILGGTMMDLSTPSFVAAVSEAGALGILASAMYKTYDGFRDAVRQVRKETSKPFAVNINLFPQMEKLDNLAYLDVAAEEGVRIFETSGFTPPAELAAKIKENNLIWMHKCVGVRYARKAESIGADAVTVVGFENGGASGNLNIATLILIPSTVDALNVPVIGGGGVVDGRTMLAVLSLGASGVIVGTRIMLSEECPMHRDAKEALLKATELETDIIGRSIGFAHRVWMNESAKKAKELEDKGASVEQMYEFISGESARRFYMEGVVDSGSISCSQGVGLIHEIKPVKEILQEMVEEAKRTHSTLPF